MLGPLLFVIYINDLPEVIDKESYLFLFADDTKVFRTINSQLDSDILQRDIKSLDDWSKKWLLTFHPDKCVSMTICNASEPGVEHRTKRNYKLNNIKLKVSGCEKDVGIHVDEHLNFDKHISSIINTANRVLAVIRKSFEYMDCEIFSLLFKGLVRPNLEYATPVWNPHLMKHINALEAVQIRATKMVPGISHLPYPMRLRKLNIPTLRYRRTRGDMIQVFKLICEPETGAYDGSIPPLFRQSMVPNLRGHNKRLFYESFNKDIRKYNFTVRTIKLWNSLPQKIIDSKTVQEFESKLDKHWGTQEMYYDNYKADIAV